MIPGNRPEDGESEARLEAIISRIEAAPIHAGEAKRALDLIERHDLWWALEVAHEFGVEIGRKTAPLPDSISEALNSGDGRYRP